MVSKSKSQTQKIAAVLARKLLKVRSSKSLVVALQGDLGAGKTAFTQGFCRALGVRHGVSSPTFLILKKHQIPKSKLQINSKIQTVFHLDLYRLKQPKEVLILGFKKIIGNPENIVLIEWPELVKKLLPKNTVWVKFKHGKRANERKIEI